MQAHEPPILASSDALVAEDDEIGQTPKPGP